MRRREFLAASAASLSAAAPNGVEREVFLKSPGKGTAVMAYAFYTKREGVEMASIEQRWSRSDTIDVAYHRMSKDHGRTWGAPVTIPTGEKRANGMWRKHLRVGFVEPKTGHYIEFWNEGVLPSDDPLEGMRQWNLYYRIGVNGTPTPIIHEGAEFTLQRPLPGVFVGKNCAMLGDQATAPIAGKDGSILVPIEISHLGPNGDYYNPGGGYTYTDGALLHGAWKGDKLVWRMSQLVTADPKRSTRGVVEPTVGILDDGRVILVIRGSNDKRTDQPSYRWISVSTDGGWKFSEPAPWTYDNGENFFSPSSCSQLLKHSNGKMYWLGNINPVNPKGNRPRFPFMIGEVDTKTGLLRKSTVRTVDDRQPGENEILSLSNFYAREERGTKKVALHMTRLFALNDGWEGDAMLYRITV